MACQLQKTVSSPMPRSGNRFALGQQENLVKEEQHENWAIWDNERKDWKFWADMTEAEREAPFAGEKTKVRKTNKYKTQD